MSTVAFSRLIEAPADEVWRVFTDLPSRPRWLCPVDEVEVLPPSVPPSPAGVDAVPKFGVGTVWRESRTGPGGSRMVEEFSVAEVAPPQHLVVISSGDGVDYRTTYTFSAIKARRPDRGRTVVTVSHEGVPTARYGRLLAVLFGGLAARAGEGALRRDLDDLAAATEPGRRIGPAAAA
ncbi:SRPBCC family protein [Plantactinospora soyae]|uniref:Uncharacterized protein YndB with AHSA1/START domain n=1 Tax=Plantactinospora soyae TaxID=1544732 RepID=A0A927M8S7_9ACTN|nr:SRPBCC family protein [Plantactinospora soyae]MBE1486565.1 uncharacterized protein YndB with AHSA1/START domain [Plantactinospora soyae]